MSKTRVVYYDEIINFLNDFEDIIQSPHFDQDQKKWAENFLRFFKERMDSNFDPIFIQDLRTLKNPIHV